MTIKTVTTHASRLVALALVASACVAPAADDVGATTDAVMAGSYSDRETMDRYFDSWMGGLNERALRAVLADDVVFESPGMRLRGADSYLALLRAGGGISCPKSGMLQRDYAGAHGGFLYMCDSVAGPLTFSEHLTVRRGKVTQTRGLFDATRFRLAQESAALVARIPAAESAHRIDDLDDVLDPAFQSHQGGRTLSRTEFKALAAQVGSAFPDFDARYQIVEADATHAVFYETVTGTHTGGAFFGVPATGRKMGTTFSGVYRIQNGKVVEEWFEGDFASLMAQLQGAMPAPTQDALIANYVSGNQAAAQDCPASLADAVNPLTITAWKSAMGPALRGDDALLEALVSPNYHVTPPGAPSIGLTGAEGVLATMGRLGTNFDFADVAPIYVGNRVVVAYGAVHYDYQNTGGLLGLPALPTPKPVTIHELHTFRTCDGRVTRQLTHVDAAGLGAQVAP